MPVRVCVSNFSEVYGFVAGFVVTGQCLSRHTVLHVVLARTQPGSIRTFEVFSVCPLATPLHLQVSGFGACQVIATGARQVVFVWTSHFASSVPQGSEDSVDRHIGWS